MTSSIADILNRMNKVNHELINCRKESKEISEVHAPENLHLSVRHIKNIGGEIYHESYRMNTEDRSLINKIMKIVIDHYNEKEEQCNQKLESMVEELKQN